MLAVLLISLLALFLLGVVAILAKKFTKEPPAPPKPVDGECCGAHAVCEKTRLVPLSEKPVYYDDEELDAFAGRAGDDYSDDEIKQIEDVFYTLSEADVSGWLCSLQVRNIKLPDYIKEQALMIVRERRG